MQLKPLREVLAVIPARGGSKGIPGKNIRPLAGRPLIAHSIEQALSSRRVTRVVVSTDAPGISATARCYGAEVVNRPAHLSGDEAPSESALLHCLDHLSSTEGYEPDLVVFLQATSPLRDPSDIDRAIETLEGANADSLFSACRIHGFVWRQSSGALESITYDHHLRPRRQDIGEDLLENGSIYIFTPQILRQTGNRLGGKIVVFEMSPLNSFQVDEPRDLQLIERILGTGQPGDESTPDLSRVRLLVLDFDGVLTDDRVIVQQDGSEAVLCHRGDGAAVERLQNAGVPVVVLSKERNPVVAVRCRKLGVECAQGLDDKLSELQQVAAARGVDADEIAYVGNDINDLSCLGWVGIPFAVADAAPDVRSAAVWVTRGRGGWGAVREICDAILRQRAVAP